MSEGEFDLIARIRRRIAARDDVALGIGDDCALLAPPPGIQLAVTMDTLNAGVHFPPETAPADIGWKALAVNLSDLAAMGAQPAWCTLSLTLPHADAAFVDGFCDGFLALAAQHDVALVGGDTTRGPLSVSIAAHGFVPAGAALRRDGARVGDEVWVSGTLGDAAGALAQWQAGTAIAPPLRARLDRPTPRVALGLALRGIASACIDISDGLLADLAHICRASGVGAELEADTLPASDALRGAFAADARRVLQATGGDDYELCFTAAAAQREAVQALGARLELPLTRIGRIVAGSGVHCAGLDDLAPGYQHFA
ncbi:thiamine-phosphate kinase [Thermomonas haemolytica]|uniref:Thiamine-monophosphate kinase n=1 Tax=Thermomonas haemolytica TaxID=141949 RepID=A0A4R3MY71_9GAMM|nr:thiamine-phosphate kinase [Thermomonas haemolytica]TCT20561.1 thiamine-phosphate kinase [Thermomonas haemolytica]TNY28952.1 thiamine-phosphate kinase [Thermomonas haemolytica]